VTWAGEEISSNRFDIAREYTERWHHQMQIREALQRPLLYEDDFFFPVLDTFMKALPYHYRGWKRENGYLLCVKVGGEDGWSWYLHFENHWELQDGAWETSDTTVSLSKENAWKVFTRWNDRSVYKATVSGDRVLGMHLLEMKCLLAY
jgi:hypothetical protein